MMKMQTKTNRIGTMTAAKSTAGKSNTNLTVISNEFNQIKHLFHFINVKTKHTIDQNQLIFQRAEKQTY